MRKFTSNRGTINQKISGGCRLLQCDKNETGKCVLPVKPQTNSKDYCSYYYDKYMNKKNPG